VTERVATMKDVAALAGVAIKTVSRVVNGEPDVGMDTRARIEAAIEQLNYRHNAAASFIRRRSSRTASIGLIVEDLASPFTTVLARVVRQRAYERQHLVMIGSSSPLRRCPGWSTASRMWVWTRGLGSRPRSSS